MKGGECSVDKDSIEGGMWQEVDDGNDEGEDKETLNRDKSYMICTKNEGIIYFYDDGQKVLECIEEIVADIGKMHISDQGIEMIINFELSGETAKAWGIGEVDENGEVIGIYPHYVFKTENGNYISDGGITFGYGHWVSQGSYNTEIEQKILLTNMLRVCHLFLRTFKITVYHIKYLVLHICLLTKQKTCFVVICKKQKRH